MKEKPNPTIIAIAIIAALALVCFVGYRVMNPETVNSAAVGQKMSDTDKQQYEQMSKGRTGSPNRGYGGAYGGAYGH